MKFLRLAALGAVLAAVLAGPAQAAPPCWRAVIDDWWDNSRVDKVYPVRCYREALANLPEDMRSYSSAPDDIARAMRAAISGRGGSDERELEGGADTGVGAAGGAGPGGGERKAPPSTSETAPAKQGGERRGEEAVTKPSEGAFRAALDELGPKDAGSVPLPLLVLAGMSAVLLAAGAASLVAKRLQAHRMAVSGAGRRGRAPKRRPGA